MKQGSLSTVFFSVLAHCLLLLILGYTQFQSTTGFSERSISPIKTYIYQRPPPKKVNESESLSQSEPPLKPLQSQNETEHRQAGVVEPSNAQPLIEQPKQVLTQQKVDTAKSPVALPKPEKNIIDIQKQLAQLRVEIDEQASYQQQVNKSNQVKSVFNPSPTLAPTSKLPINSIEQKAKNTTRYTDDLAIIKSDNGTCLIEEDLSKVGIDGVKAISSFACGESKFDRSFREHMKKVSQKLNPKTQ